MPVTAPIPHHTPPAYVSKWERTQGLSALQTVFSEGYSEIQESWLAKGVASRVELAANEEMAAPQFAPAVPKEMFVSLPTRLTGVPESFGRGESLATYSSREWLRSAFQKLKQFSELPLNWDSYGAEHPNAIATERAENALRLLYRLNSEPSRLAASAEGGVTISFFQGKKYGDIEFFNNGEMLAIISRGTGTPEVWEVSNDDYSLTSALEKIRDFVRAK